MKLNDHEQARFTAFQNFDAVCKDAEGKSPASEEDVKLLVRTMIDALPQRAVIRDEDVGTWIDQTYRSTYHRLADEFREKPSFQDVFRHCSWHVRRASGFGGSEIWAVVSQETDENDGFESLSNIVKGKLLQIAPLSGNLHMRRGIRAEDVIQQIYLAKSGNVSLTDDLASLRGYRWPKFPMIIGTPDDLVMTKDGVRRCVDYKAPSEDVFQDIEKKGVPNQYVAQLHHYFVVAKSAGIQIDDLKLVPFHYKTWDTPEIEVPLSVDLVRRIIVKSSSTWEDYVMKGLIPDDPKIAVLNETSESLEEKHALRHVVTRAAILNLVQKAIEEEYKQVRKTLSSVIGDRFDLAVGKVDAGYATINRSRSWDEDRLTQLATQGGLDVDTFMVPSTSPDPKECVKILEAVLEARHDPDALNALLSEVEGLPRSKSLDCDALAARLLDEGINPLPAAGTIDRFSLTRKKKGPEAEMRDRVENVAKSVVSDVSQYLYDNVEMLEESFMAVPEELPPLPQADDDEECVPLF